jgi:flagellum-specific ATP synthase
MNDIITKEHLEAVMKFRRLYTLLKENEMLIRIGAYTKGTDTELDEAIEKKKAMEEFVTQYANEQIEYQKSVEMLIGIMGANQQY